MTGYGPRAEAIREVRGLPYATGADDPPAWHDPVPDWYWNLFPRPETTVTS